MQKNNGINEFLEKGSLIAGNATGAVLSYLSSSPEAAVVGATIGSFISIVGEVVSDFNKRENSEREKIRAAGTACLTISKIKTKIDAGNEIRCDDFFRLRTGYRPIAEELFEGILIKSKSQYEEHKLHFFANLYTNACFDNSLSQEEVSWFMSILDRLTFSHLETLNEFVSLGEDSAWTLGDIAELSKHEPVIAAHVEELKSLRLINAVFWADDPLKANHFASKLIEKIDFSNPFDRAEAHVISRNGAKNI